MGREDQQVQLRLGRKGPPESLEYRCNLCGAANRRPAADLVRESSSCDSCESSGRMRALVWLMSDELFGVPLTLPDFPAIRSWTAMGMSDIEDFAVPLAKKFSYTNTHYHKPPLFDITKPDPALDGKFDFIVSSEVLEHVPHPVAPAFETLYRMLKPNGVLFLTVPYSPEATTVEHYPELHDFAVTQLRERWVLVNRTKDGRVQTFDDLVFHGGPGSTLEMRVFNEATLKQLLADAGFQSIRIAGESCPEFGILPDDPWSLPMAVRKGNGRIMDSAAWKELAVEYAAVKTKLRVNAADLSRRNADYEEYVAWAKSKVGELERETVRGLDWGHAMEKNVEEHLAHIGQLQAAYKEAEGALERLNQEFEERTAWAVSLEQEKESLKARLQALESSRWRRFGRRLGLSH